MPIRAVLFDVGETLWHAEGAPPAAEFRRLAAERAAAALASQGCVNADADLAARLAWEAMETAIRDARSGDLRERDYAEAARLALAASGIVLSHDGASALLDAIYVSGAEGGKTAFPDAAPTLLALRARGFRLGIVTNRAFGGERFRADLRDTGLEAGWEVISVSVEVGWLKPHPAAFEHALATLRIEPGEALMVGNSLAEDVRGAQQAGIRAAWRRSPADAEGILPDFEFGELVELLDIPELAGPQR